MNHFSRLLVLALVITTVFSGDGAPDPVSLYKHQLTSVERLNFILDDTGRWSAGKPSVAEWYKSVPKEGVPLRVAQVRALASVLDAAAAESLWTADSNAADQATITLVNARLAVRRAAIVQMSKSIAALIDPLSSRPVEPKDILLFKPLEITWHDEVVVVGAPYRVKEDPAVKSFNLLLAQKIGPDLWATDQTEAQIISFRLQAERARFLSQQLSLPLVEADAGVVAKGYEGWTNFYMNGYPQYPWELWVNSWGTRHISEPPNVQWIALHPEPGVAFRATHDYQDVKPELALMVHAFGVIAYPTESNSWYLGIAGTAALNDEFGLGWGGTLLFGGKALSSTMPPISIGYHFYDVDGDGHLDYNRPSIALGIDLAALLFKDQMPAGLVAPAK